MTPPPQLSASTRLFAVCGHPVSHSLSPAFQNAGLQEMGIPGIYLAFDVEPQFLQGSLEAFSHWRAGGVNLTIPLKETACDLMDTLADSASFAGCVNTVAFGPNGEMTGHSTDGAGLIRAVRESFGEGFQGRNILILGCGGAGRAAALQAAKEGAARVMLANRTRSRAETVEQEIRERLPGVDVNTLASWPPAPEEIHAAELIIHSTSLGMDGRPELTFTTDHFREGQHLLDMIYTREVTPMMAVARSAGANTVNGIGMLLHQGVESLRIWTGKEPPVEKMRTALISAVNQREAAHVG